MYKLAQSKWAYLGSTGTVGSGLQEIEMGSPAFATLAPWVKINVVLEMWNLLAR
jgi:hypothetical protein